MLLNHTDIALTAEDLAIYHQERIIGLVSCSSTMKRYRQCGGNSNAYALASVTTTASSG